ncbi:hypothetical protein JNUCC0626_42500 [Lentzea sp. JNUCC 0626]|uniref:hypothetical protein n=1 Tax=Lentzea sp. JNUCC 0626 TaxID=3367513 RepID=UPI00374A8D2C
MRWPAPESARTSKPGGTRPGSTRRQRRSSEAATSSTTVPGRLAEQTLLRVGQRGQCFLDEDGDVLRAHPGAE